MIKKVIALVFVSFFVMSGLTVLNENNQNYNIAGNNINTFVDSSSFSPINYTLNDSITYSSAGTLGYDISASAQSFICYDNSLYFINGNSIMQLNVISNTLKTFISTSSQSRQLEIYNNYMIIGYGSGNHAITSNLFQIYDFSTNKLYNITVATAYNYMQFAMNNNNMYIAGITTSGYIYIYSISLSTDSTTLVTSISIDSVSNQLSVAGFGDNFIFAINVNTCLQQLGYANIITQSLNSSINDGTVANFGNLYYIIDLGNYGLLGSQSWYVNNNNGGGSTQYSFNAYDSGLFFSDSNYNKFYLPFYSSNNFTKLPIYDSIYQEFCYDNNIKYLYLPIGLGNTVFNSPSYIISGVNNLFIVNKNNVYVYKQNPPHYILTVKSYNSFSSQINNYLLFNGKLTTTSILINETYPCVPTIIPLNYSTYYYKGSKIIITPSDYTGTYNKYYNLSIYYNQVQAPSIPLYNIFTYMYPISIIGLFVGMGAFIFTIKKRGYKI